MARFPPPRSAVRRSMVPFIAFQVLFAFVVVITLKWLEGATASLPGSRAGSGVALPNCTVVLSQADKSLLRTEVASIVHSLADGNAWLGHMLEAPGGPPDVVARGEDRGVVGTEIPRPVDQVYGRQTDESVPGVEDVYAELKRRMDDSVDAMTTDLGVAMKRQRRTPAAELGLAPIDPLNETASIPLRIRFLNHLAAEKLASEKTRVAIVATVGADIVGVRRELLPWMQYHTELGVTAFYLLYDGRDPAAVEALRTVRHVSLIHVHQPWASEEDSALQDLYAGLARQWKGRPGNYALMVTQGFGQQQALARARRDGFQWLMHLDPDELLYPGGSSPSITEILARTPPHIAAVRFMDCEGQAEAGDLTNRYEQISLFRVHKHFITPEAHFYRNKFKLGSNPTFLVLYANGKSAVRVDAPGVRQMGPHFWGGDPSPRWQTPDNEKGEFTMIVDDAAMILHYTYSYISDVAEKAHRSCPDEYLAAARAGDKSKLKECFVIGVDRDAYMAAAAGSEAVHDFFYSRFVLSEGVPVACRDPELKSRGWCSLNDIPRLTYLLEKIGLYRRIHFPSAILRQHERAIRLLGQAQEGEAAISERTLHEAEVR